MSLINQMLRDLENRRKLDGRQLPGGEGPAVITPQGSSQRMRFIVVGGFLLSVLVWGGLEFSAWQVNRPQVPVKQVSLVQNAKQDLNATQPVRPDTGSSPITVAVVAEKNPVAASAAAPVANPRLEAGSAAVAQRKAVPAAIASDIAPPQTAAVVDLLNLGLVEAVASTRLMLEFEQIPKYSWRFIGNDKRQIVLDLRQTGASAALNIPLVKGPLLKTISLKSENMDLQLLVEASQNLKLDMIELPADPFHRQRLMIELSTQAMPTVAITRPEEKKSGAVPAVGSKPATKAAPPVSRVSKIIPKLSPEEQARQSYQVALKQLQNNENLAAETSLAAALTLQPSFVDARLQLIALLKQGGRDVEAEKQTLQGLQLQPAHPELRKGYARRLMETGHLAEASAILQSNPRPEVGSDLEYHALLAALQQELGEHQNAAKSYRKLLSFRPREALWWLGLGISLDQFGNGAEAKEAYLRAVSLPDLRDDLRAYVSSRLQIL